MKLYDLLNPDFRSVPNLISAHNLDQIEVLRSAAAMLIGTIGNFFNNSFC